MKTRLLYRRVANLFFVFFLGLCLAYSIGDGMRSEADKWIGLLALVILLWGVRDLLHLLADLWSEL
ncbi:MAG: hypothetical protein HC804_01750 [Anaerolineae bacterium]|nr:hypothetical protein [Anaerolineae bacterium]